MSITTNRAALMLAIPAMLLGLPDLASAQMSNQPFRFNAPGPSGVGMSNAGKQAILEQALSGATPRILLKDPQTGNLLPEPVRAKGRTAIVSTRAGDIIPGYRGRDFRGNRRGMGVGVFNAYFVSGRGSGSVMRYSGYGNGTSGPVNTWTARVVTGDGRAVYGPATAVSVWTGQVSSLQRDGVP